MTMPTDPADLVLIGRVIRPQGRRGEVLVEPFSDSPERFPGLQQAFVCGGEGEPREVRVEFGWAHKGRFVLKLEGVDTIDAAEGLRGGELRIAEGELAPLPEGSYYHHQLCGLCVEDAAGAEIGVVEDVMETGASTRVLVVRGGAGETLLPFAADFVKKVDLARGLLIITPPEYVFAD
jgi:16S rRNA processing protein RimM